MPGEAARSSCGALALPPRGPWACFPFGGISEHEKVFNEKKLEIPTRSGGDTACGSEFYYIKKLAQLRSNSTR